MKLRFDSILTRVVLIQVVMLGVMALALFAAFELLLNSEAVEFERRSLQSHAAMLSHSLTATRDGRVVVVLPSPEREYFARGLGGLTYAVTDDDGVKLAVSRSGDLPQLITDPRAGVPVYFQSSDKQSSYLGISVPAHVGGRNLWIQVTRKIRHPDLVTGDVAAYFLSRISWIAIPITLVCLLVAVYATKRMLRPIQSVSDLAGAICPARLDLRLPAQTLPREIVPLVEAVNRALNTLERSFHLQRDFTANAAHELRTPLAILRVQIENLSDRDAAASLREDIDAMSHIVDQLLNAAEFEGTVVGENDIADLHQVASEVIAFMEPLALARGKDIALTGEEGAVRINGSAQMLHHALRNLIDNALKYSPPGTCVEVELDAAGIIRVLDRGPGVPEDQREAIFRRFWRADRTKTDGAGLGLSIVARVVEAHGGKISVTARPGGGAVFTIDLTGQAKRLH